MHSESLLIKLKHFARDTFHFIAPHWEKAFYALAGIILVAQITVLGSYTIRNQDEKSVVYALDNDAGRAISTAEKTRWWNSNHFAPYGPIYYRVAHTIASLVPYAGPGEYHPLVKSQRIHNLALQLASLLSLYALALLVSCILLPLWWQRLLLTPLMVSALTHSYWANMVLRPHPDMILALTAGLATYATARWIYQERLELEKWCAMAWGVAVGTKASVILFTPAFVFLFFPWNKTKLTQGLKFVGWMLLGYTLIGFPQSLSYYKVTKFLLGETAVTSPADWQTFMTWIHLLFDQLVWPFAIALIVVLLASKKEFHFESKKALKLFLFCLIPTLVLFTRKQAYNTNHFTMPFYSCLFIGCIYILRQTFTASHKPLFVLAFLVLPTIPPDFQKYFTENQKCKPEAREFAALLSNLQESGKHIYHDPYVPVTDVFTDKATEIWGMRWEDLKGEPVDALALNKTLFYSRYLVAPPSHLWPKERDEWPVRRAFYQGFADGGPVTAPDSTVWKKSYENACGMELWLKDSP
jgi:hypothetical protein